MPPSPAIALKRILVPVDLSPASLEGLRFAAAVAERFGAELDLLHVVELPSYPDLGYARLPRREAKLRKTATKKFLQFKLESGINPRLVHSVKVTSGKPDSEISEAALAEKNDLVVIASHGVGTLKHALLGSTAERVVRHAPCPVLTVREPVIHDTSSETRIFQQKRILVPTDFSEASKNAFPYATAFARQLDATIVLVHVVPSTLPAELSHIGIVLEEKRLIAEAQERLPQFRVTELDASLHVETQVRNGNPAHEISMAAKELNADLVVISTHGHTGLKHFWLGSVTERVVRHAPCPVLVVREREHEFVTPRSSSLGCVASDFKERSTVTKSGKALEPSVD